MTLPPGFLDELRARTSLMRVVGRKVQWDMRKSNQAKGDFWAPCPFHQERTASFHVDERKGYYYCFGCQAKGDAVTFLREAENMSFLEAVETLAREAGMAMPARDPRAAAAADRRAALAEAMEQAVRFYRMQLAAAAGAPARDYLDRRGLSVEIRDRFEIGYAPEGRTALLEALLGRGFSEDLIVEAGLAARPEGGGAPYDRFRGRVIFPIRDARGRCIALGGRALDPAARAKYLNSPETPLFDKGRTLYNIGPAREAAARGAPIIVAEGYMDVIALVAAGFPGAVAPLGTAITADQLAQLWRIAPEPVVALDGDAAGLRAAMRLVDLALPLIGPGQGLRFALLPGGMDPDDLIRQGGPSAMARVLAAAEPMVALLWRRETEGRLFDSPERRAGLDRRLAEILRMIRDPGLRRHYEEALRARRAELFGLGPAGGRGAARAARAPRPGGAAPGGGWQRGGAPRGAWPIAAKPAAGTRASTLAAAPPGAEEIRREALILATLALHPALLPEFEEALDRMDCAGAGHGALREALLATLAAAPAGGLPGPGELAARLPEAAAAALDRALARPDLRIAPTLRAPGDLARARACLTEEFARLLARRGAAREIAHLEQDIAGFADESVDWRAREVATARERAERIALAPGGGEGEDRAAIAARLAELLSTDSLRRK